MIIDSEQTTYEVRSNGRKYRVVRRADSQTDGEYWSVFAHHLGRLCDPAKPMHKRVVAALIAKLQHRGNRR